VKKRHVLRLRPAGMFSNVNELVQHLYLATIDGRAFDIVWDRSSYRQDDREGDPWEYYFEPCFPNAVRDEAALKPLPSGHTQKNIITPRLQDGQSIPLLLPTDRRLPHDLIKKYIRLKQHVAEIIGQFKRRHFGGYVIGLHIRGLGRNHGGADKLRAMGQHAGKLEIDYDQFFKYVDQRLASHPNAKIFFFSASQDVVDRVHDSYPDRAISYGVSRSDFGEMHAKRAENADLNFSPYKLGLDVIVEAYLLSATDYFVHGNSNVSNYVLCLDPELESEYVYRSEVAKAYPRQFNSSKSVVASKLLVVSFGGVATTSLIRTLSKKMCCNAVDDQDGLKHLCSPDRLREADSGKAVTRVLYVYNDPLLALRSLYRRNFGQYQHRKIVGDYPYLPDDALQDFGKLQEMTVKAGRDVFGLEQHFSSWYQDCRLPAMFVDMRDPEAISKISRFVGEDVEFEIGERIATTENCSADMIDIYRRLDENILGLIAACSQKNLPD